jgi:hypothetical protein
MLPAWRRWLIRQKTRLEPVFVSVAFMRGELNPRAARCFFCASCHSPTLISRNTRACRSSPAPASDRDPLNCRAAPRPEQNKGPLRPAVKAHLYPSCHAKVSPTTDSAPAPRSPVKADISILHKQVILIVRRQQRCLYCPSPNPCASIRPVGRADQGSFRSC